MIHIPRLQPARYSIGLPHEHFLLRFDAAPETPPHQARFFLLVRASRVRALSRFSRRLRRRLISR
jgi:hypothetical protein